MPHCSHCGSNDNIRRGSKKRPNRYQCKQCQNYFTDRAAPKVLVFDIETLPAVAYTWGVRKQFLTYDNILADFVVLSWGAKWLFDSEIMSDILTPREARERVDAIFNPKATPPQTDRRTLGKIWKLLDEADVVITQNGVRFDSRKLNTRFMFYGMPPPRPYHHIDTLLAAWSAFGNTSNKLDDMMRFLQMERKEDTNYELWKQCSVGEKKALDTMISYNRNDVQILEDYYARIRAWIPNHPNFSAYTNKYVDLKEGEQSCPVCRGVITDSSYIAHYRSPLGYLYRQFRCQHCGTVGRQTARIPHQSIEVRRSG